MVSRRDDKFLALWRRYGDSLTWEEYARRLSQIEQRQVEPAALKVWVSRNRERLFEEYGVTVGPRLVRADEEFEAWPQLPRDLRKQSQYRLLEYHARARQHGASSLPPSIREKYTSQRDRMIRNNEIIRYDPGYGLYLDKRTPQEVQADPRHERLSETKEAYRARQSRVRGP